LRTRFRNSYRRLLSVEPAILQISIAPSASNQSWATVTFDHDPPEVLKKEYEMDSSFIGFTTLTDNGETSIDIVVLPGLAGHPLGSYRSPTSTSVWIRDWLNIPSARVLIYGYDTKLEGSASRASLQDLAKMFLNSLAAQLEYINGGNNKLRPLIFIAHSLGGLVVKEALTLAYEENQYRKSKGQEPNNDTYNILLSTSALIFFGVPNNGMRSEQLSNVVKGRPNEFLVRDLKVDDDHEASPFLALLAQRFKICFESQSPSFEIVAFFETEESPTVERSVSTGRLGRTGPKVMLVTKSSACAIGLGNNFFKDFPLQTDHSGLVKFENDEVYRGVRKQILLQAENAPSIVKKRFENNDGAPSK
jgi:hypothetical protein